MSLNRSTEIYINRPQQIISQFRHRDPLNLFDGGPLPAAVETVFYAGFLSDVRVQYITIIHVTGAAAIMVLRSELDGTDIGTGNNLANNTLYYVHLSPDQDAHLYNVNRTMYCSDESEFGQSFGNIRVTPAVPGVSNVRIRVRYVQL